MKRIQGLCLAFFSLALLSSPPLAGGELKIVHINVGQGDATLIIGPLDNGTRVAVLVDSGESRASMAPDGGRLVLDRLRRHGVTSLDFFVASHYHSDHIGGIASGPNHRQSFALGEDQIAGTSDDVPIRNFVDRGTSPAPTSQAAAQCEALANAANRISLATQADVDGFSIDLGDEATMIAVAGNGFVRGQGRAPGNKTENYRSVVFLVRYHGFDYLVGGDAIGRDHASEDAEVEQAIAAFLEAEGISVDVLQVNHHGGNNASAEDFLAIVRPEVAVISTGNDNTHKHPHRDTLRRLVDSGALVVQTEAGKTPLKIFQNMRVNRAVYQGDVIVTTDGTTYELSTFRLFQVDG